ncbi:MAG: hypothetical protein IJY16_09460 [Clostridia bacterium]|nr:hypothetical protein [Clostridia bacterium]
MNKGRFSFGAVGRFFTRMSTLIYYVISASFIGKIFTSYPASDGAIRHSYIGSLGHVGGRRGARKRHTARRAVACAMERNVLSRVTGWLLRALGRCSLRTFGLFFISFAAFSALMYILATTVWHNDVANWGNLIAAACAFLTGVLLTFSDQSVAYSVCHGLTGAFLGGVFGLADDGVQEPEQKGRQRYFVAVLLGAAVGALGMLVQPWVLLGAAVAILVAIMVLSLPETGVMLFLLYVPYVGYVPYGKALLLLVTVLFLAGYSAKLLRGNRVFRLEAQDIPVVALLLFFGFSAFSVAEGALFRALTNVCLLLAYFPIMNIVATTKWLARCRVTLSFSAAMASVVGILQFVINAVKMDGVDMALLGNAVKAGFVDHTTFAYFLVIAFAFTFPAIFTSRKSLRPLAAIASLLILTATVLAWVQSAWIALLLIVVVFALVFEKRSFPFLFLGSGAAVGTYFLLPDRVQAVIVTFLQETSDRALSRNAVTGAIFEIFFGREVMAGSAGVTRFIFGLGNGGLEALYPVFGAVGTQFVEGACSFWLALVCELGVVGAAIPALLFFLLLQNAFTALRNARYREKPALAYVGVCLVASTLFLSFFRSAWYDPAALLIFFIAIALVGAGLRHDRHSHVNYSDVAQTRFVAEIEYRAHH